MLASEDIVFKCVREIPAGAFVDKETGETIEYKSSYRLRFDKFVKGLPQQEEIRITQEQAFNIAKNYKLYDKAIITYDIKTYKDKSNKDVTMLYFHKIEHK